MSKLLSVILFYVVLTTTAMATSISIGTQCSLNNCNTRVCVDGRCTKFTGAAKGEFVRNTWVLELFYPNKAKKYSYYQWYTKRWLSGRALTEVCPECSNGRNQVRSEVRVSGSTNIGGVNVTVSAGNLGGNVRVETPRRRREGHVVRVQPTISASLRSQIERKCDRAFSFGKEIDCVFAIIESNNPEAGLAKLEIVDDEVLGQDDKMRFLRQVLNMPISTRKVKLCLDEMSFEDGKSSCLGVANRVSERNLEFCLESASFDDDRMTCLRRASR